MMLPLSPRTMRPTPSSSARPAACSKAASDIERIYQVWFTAFPDLLFKERDLLIDDDGVALLMTVDGHACR